LGSTPAEIVIRLEIVEICSIFGRSFGSFTGAAGASCVRAAGVGRFGGGKGLTITGAVVDCGNLPGGGSGLDGGGLGLGNPEGVKEGELVVASGGLVGVPVGVLITPAQQAR
jgi:hypothetical protein